MSDFAEIVLDRRMPKNLETLSYSIPENLAKNIKEGSYVNVPLRNMKIPGIVLRRFSEKPDHATKDINELLHEIPILESWQIKLSKWMSEYYQCSLQKCISLFTPPKFYFDESAASSKSVAVNLQQKLVLTKDQKSAYEKIINSKKKISLLHGITGSGKTEVYLHLAEHYIKKGKQCLLIVPEISLTPQMVQYFEKIFGNNVAILHSRLTQKQRSLQWMKIYFGKAQIVIGPRSAAFAPLKNIGLIVMDEEHEFSYKQEQAPRYHTLSVIEKMSELLDDVKIVLGSATPSISSYNRAKQGEFELIELNERVMDGKIPPVTLVDLREEFKKHNYSILSDLLQEKIANSLSQKKQVVLFLNKRGSASAIVCRECGYMKKCDACDVPMTYHKYLPGQNSAKSSLICHHCGIIKEIPKNCPECKGVSIKYVGAGTQKVEDEVSQLFPDAKIARVDKDTVATRGSFNEIYKKFKKGEIDILIGTQMIGKGLHFPNVNLVGVILADIGLHFPDFRSSERTFQLLTQVAGRTGRGKVAGEVVFQTYMPENLAIQFAQMHDFKNFYKHEIEQRNTFNYPPFSKLIKLTFVDESAKKAFIDAQKTFEELKANVEKSNSEIANSKDKYQINIYPALIYKLHNKYRWNILIQGENPNEIIKKSTIPENCRIDIDPTQIS